MYKPTEKGPKNSESRAHMPLLPEMKAFLLKLRSQQEKNKQEFGSKYHENGYICKHRDGRPFEFSYVNRKLQEILKQNNMTIVTLHGLRHSTATLLAKLGFSDLEIQAWLRHKDIRSTIHYTHNSADRRINPGKGISDYFNDRGEDNKS
ncbi:tyrosine-type recombinase/integrase [Christensenellaceae bacterium OttesenSCG-928-K19]|nr:tyrosine-type recombinase/integrase [Christensenellaceae bacterium OttesenSCG-928-K19]